MTRSTATSRERRRLRRTERSSTASSRRSTSRPGSSCTNGRASTTSALRESYALAVGSSTAEPFDFFHINSIGVDRDGSLLISSRNTWTVYDLNPGSGQIIWRLGGRHSSFRPGPGTGTAWQHDPRELADGSISIFDNGAYPTVHAQSRGDRRRARPAESHRDARHAARRTRPRCSPKARATCRRSPTATGSSAGGRSPYFSEFSPEGKLLFDAHFPANTQSYRDFRFAWTGTPAHGRRSRSPPRPARGTVYASWNGATLVSSWGVLAGASPASLTAVSQVPRSGFETAIAVPAGTTGPYLRGQGAGRHRRGPRRVRGDRAERPQSRRLSTAAAERGRRICRRASAPAMRSARRCPRRHRRQCSEQK